MKKVMINKTVKDGVTTTTDSLGNVTTVTINKNGETVRTIKKVDGTTITINTPEGIYDGTLRVVTEADVLADPRVVAAGAVVGQLYDFSNLPYVKDGALEAYVETVNDKKADVEIQLENGPVGPEFTSEAERIAMGVKNPDSPHKGATE